MLKKLFSLIWTLFTDRHIGYNWKNLWWYLTKGYTWADVQDGDRYILNQVYLISQELDQFKNKLYELTIEDILNKKPNPLHNAIFLYTCGYFDLFEPEWQIRIQNTIKKELSKQIFDLWV